MYRIGTELKRAHQTQFNPHNTSITCKQGDHPTPSALSFTIEQAASYPTPAAITFTI